MENALVKFRERAERQSQTMGAEFLNPSDDLRVAVQIMNHPVGVDEISYRSDIG